MNAKFNGKVMAEARRAEGLDQAELALRVSRNRVTISDIERGKLQPSRDLAQSIAQVLGLDVESLYEAANHGLSTGAVSLTIEELQVIDAMRHLDPVLRAKVWAFAQGLAAGGGIRGASAAAELAEAIEVASRAEPTGNTHANSA